MKLHFLAPKKRLEDGYGNSTHDLKAALLKRGIEINDNIHDRETDHDFALIYGPPEYAQQVKEGTPYAIFTMWETEEPPKEWEPYLKGAEFVLNPSVWGCKVFSEYYGLENVYHAPLGYKQDVFQYRARPKRKDFTFLSYNSGFGAVRKGFLELVEAFKLAFKPNEPVKLHIKSARPDFWNTTHAQLEWNKLRQKDGKTYDNIHYFADPCPPNMLEEYCYRADAFVFPSRGEGFGHTPLEAMATGLPVIISSGHGMSEYFNPNINYTFDTHMEKAEFDREGDFGDWPVANVESLADVMRHIFENQDEARDYGKMGPRWARQWTYERTANRVIAAILKHSPTLSPNTKNNENPQNYGKTGTPMGSRGEVQKKNT